MDDGQSATAEKDDGLRAVRYCPEGDAKVKRWNADQLTMEVENVTSKGTYFIKEANHAESEN